MASVGPRPTLSRNSSLFNGPKAPVSVQLGRDEASFPLEAVLELADGSAFRGISFGADGKSVAGECVFQTGEPRSGSHSVLLD